MKKILFTALSPNTQGDDIFLALKVLWMPWKWKKGGDLSKSGKHFAAWLPAKHVFFFESGRTSLYAILKALNIQENDEVLLQAYTCVAVPEPILWIDARPIYVDCEEKNFTMSTEDLEKKITPKSKVLIIQHTFGHPADIEKLLAIARKHNLFVIEDCAHALGSKYKGKQLGTFGDAAFFSFGRDKVISSVFGGAVATNSEELAKKIGDFHKSCKTVTSSWIVQQLLHPLITGISKLTYNIYLGKIILAVAKKLKILSKALYQEEKEGGKPPFIFKKMPNGLAILAYHQFQKLNELNAHRREIAKLYQSGLIKMPFQLPQYDENDSIFLRYNLQTSENKLLINQAKKEGIYLGDWYTTGIAPEGVDYDKICYDPLQCPVAERVAAKSVNLPTDIHIKKDDALRIIHFLKKFYGT